MAENQIPEIIPPEVDLNILKVLKRRPAEGYDFVELAKVYFSEFKVFVYPERYGLKTWVDILTRPELASQVELYNQNVCVRIAPSALIRPPPVPPAQTNGTHIPSQGPSTLQQVQRNGSRGGTPTSGHAAVPKRERSSSVSSAGSSGRQSDRSSGSASKRQKPEAMETASCSEDTYVTDVTHISTTPENQAKISRERNNIAWIPRESNLVPLSFSTLILERGIGPERPAMYIDCTYCDRSVLEQLMEVKGNIKHVTAAKFAAVRNKHNEFELEKGRGGIFQHGSAIRFANIDVLFNHALSNPKAGDGTNLVQSDELLYFVDIYGGPGGLVEYMLWKRKWEAKGFGITPRGASDYNLLQAEHFPKESFEPFYGEDGIEGTGDINKPYNLSKFATFVRESTGGRGAHVVVSSGGDRNDYVDEDQKEIRCKYIFMSEFLCALQVLRKDGHYLTRLYDMYTPFTVGLLYLMYRTFDNVAVFKPESSLPASSERYIMCRWRKSDFHIREIQNYLAECHKMDWCVKRERGRRNDEPADILHLVSRDRIKESYGFCQYIHRLNNELGRRQFHETRNLIRRIMNKEEQAYVAERLKEISTKCLDFWEIPTTTRQKPKYAKATTAEIRAKKLVTPYPHDFFQTTELTGESELTLTTLQDEIIQPREWRFMSIGRSRGWFLCLGGSSIYKFGGAKWSEINDRIELMNNTLVYGDLVDEIKMNGSNQTIKTSLHIIDALILGGTDIRNLPADERNDLISKYARSVSKASRQDLATVRVKPQYEMKYFPKYMDKIRETDHVRSKDGDSGSRVTAPVTLHQDQGLVYCPAGVLFVKVTKQNFAPADTRFCMSNRLFWNWTPDTDLKVPLDTSIPGQVEQNGDGYDPMDDDKKIIASTADIVRHLTTLGSI